jgi:hypothetical protein
MTSDASVSMAENATVAVAGKTAAAEFSSEVCQLRSPPGFGFKSMRSIGFRVRVLLRVVVTSASSGDDSRSSEDSSKFVGCCMRTGGCCTRTGGCCTAGSSSLSSEDAKSVFSFRSSEINIGVFKVRPVDPTLKSTVLGGRVTSVCLKSSVS